MHAPLCERYIGVFCDFERFFTGLLQLKLTFEVFRVLFSAAAEVDFRVSSDARFCCCWLSSLVIKCGGFEKKLTRSRSL